MHLLIVEDNENIRMSLEDCLDMENIQSTACSDIQSAKESFAKTSFDGIILDIMLPDGDGYQFARWVREKNESIFILMLTARELEKDKIEGFESGADDYVTKPFSSQELIYRIKAMARRLNGISNKQYSSTTVINDVTVHWSSQTCKKADDTINLSPKAFAILHYLFQSLNQGCSRQQVLDNVWGENIYVDERTIDNFISQLKKEFKLVSRKSILYKKLYEE